MKRRNSLDPTAKWLRGLLRSELLLELRPYFRIHPALLTPDQKRRVRELITQ